MFRERTRIKNVVDAVDLQEQRQLLQPHDAVDRDFGIKPERLTETELAALATLAHVVGDLESVQFSRIC